MTGWTWPHETGASSVSITGRRFGSCRRCNLILHLCQQLIAGEEAYVNAKGKKPLSIAVEEISKGFVTIEPETTDENEGQTE